jgi:NADH dehydrogenase FAD-containing subunit
MKLTCVVHTMGAPLAHTSASFTSEAWLRYRDISALAANKVQVLQGKAVGVDMGAKVLSYSTENTETQTVHYDYLVVASGIKRAWPIVPRAVNKELYLHDAQSFMKELSTARSIALVGGGKIHSIVHFRSAANCVFLGAVGVEMAAEIKCTFPSKEVYLIHSRQSLLSAEPLPILFKQKAKELLQAYGVHLILDRRVVRGLEDSPYSSERNLTLSDGEIITFDTVINTAVSPSPNTSFLPKGALDGDGYVAARKT